MSLADIDMKKKLNEYKCFTPVKTVKFYGDDFSYRYYKNPRPDINATLLVIEGGTGFEEVC